MVNLRLAAILNAQFASRTEHAQCARARNKQRERLSWLPGQRCNCAADALWYIIVDCLYFMVFTSWYRLHSTVSYSVSPHSSHSIAHTGFSYRSAWLTEQPLEYGAPAEPLASVTMCVQNVFNTLFATLSTDGSFSYVSDFFDLFAKIERADFFVNQA